jgi:hypothetical protein
MFGNKRQTADQLRRLVRPSRRKYHDQDRLKDAMVLHIYQVLIVSYCGVSLSDSKPGQASLSFRSQNLLWLNRR